MAASLTAVLDDRFQFQSPWFIFNFWEPCYIYLVFSKLGLSTSLYTKFNVSCNSLPNSLFTCSKITQYSHFAMLKWLVAKFTWKNQSYLVAKINYCKTHWLLFPNVTIFRSTIHYGEFSHMPYKLMDNRKLIVCQKSCGLILSLIPML